MSQIVLSTKIARGVKEELEKFCEARGFKMNKFIERALLEQINREKAYGPATVANEFFDEDTWQSDWALKEMDAYDKL